jgi:hypothetical protein
MNTYLRSVDDDVGVSLVVCTLCLSVLRGASWVEAEEVIRELRSFELPSLPRLVSGRCNDCSEEILLRRDESHRTAAA